MKLAHISKLAELASDVAAIDGAEILGVNIGMMADGSGRSCALVETYSCGLEQTYRISSPAPADGPRWTRSFDRWLVEVRVGEGDWLLLIDDLDEVLS